MQDPSPYRVVNRKSFLVIMALMTSAVAVGVWVGLDHLALYVEELKQLAETEPDKAATTGAELVRAFAIVNATVLLLFAVVIVRNGWRGWKSASMPPAGSRILEGQRTWSGEPAVRVAKFTIAVGAILAVLGLASTLLLWDLSESFKATSST